MQHRAITVAHLRSLLARYVVHVTECEGVHYLDGKSLSPHITPEDALEIKTIVREECPGAITED